MSFLACCAALACSSSAVNSETAASAGASGQSEGFGGAGGSPSGVAGLTASGGSTGIGAAGVSGGGMPSSAGGATGGAMSSGGVAGSGGISSNTTGGSAGQVSGPNGGASAGGTSAGGMSTGGTVAGLPAVSNDGDGDVTIGPNYTQATEMTYVAGVPKGTVTMFTMNSGDSTIYPGINGAYMRNVWVYVPAQYVAGTAAPFILAQDGDNYILRLPPILDNMIAAKRLPVMIAVMANSGGGNDKGSERGLEYDTVSDKFLSFVETELLPRAASEAHVTF
ncbi:MAG TPA: hypothetical protein VL137_06600, partial [Polyangiaceae bacterium]|nr:hypothetical protein [Polyangiaceae bacterium]